MGRRADPPAPRRPRTVWATAASSTSAISLPNAIISCGKPRMRFRGCETGRRARSPPRTRETRPPRWTVCARGLRGDASGDVSRRRGTKPVRAPLRGGFQRRCEATDAGGGRESVPAASGTRPRPRARAGGTSGDVRAHRTAASRAARVRRSRRREVGGHDPGGGGAIPRGLIDAIEAQRGAEAAAEEEDEDEGAAARQMGNPLLEFFRTMFVPEQGDRGEDYDGR